MIFPFFPPLPATLLVVAPLVMLMAGPVQAELASSQTASSSTTFGAASPILSGADKTGDGVIGDDHAKELSKDVSGEGKLLKDHLEREARDEEKKKTAKADATKTAPRPETGAQKTARAKEDDWGNDFLNAIRDLIKPIKKDVSESEVAQVIKEIDQKVNTTRPQDHETPVVVLVDLGAPATSAEQAQRDRDASGAALQQLIQDAKPYAIGLVTVLVLGYLSSLVWNYLQWKKNKRLGRLGSGSGGGKNSRSGAERSSRSRKDKA